jgi:hypothetical protein
MGDQDQPRVSPTVRDGTASVCPRGLADGATMLAFHIRRRHDKMWPPANLLRAVVRRDAASSQKVLDIQRNYEMMIAQSY